MNIEQLRAEFEEKFPMPDNCQWCGNGYAPTEYNAMGAQSYVDMFKGWIARSALQSQDREDAERYRWLRNRASHEGICVVHIDYWSDEYRGQAHCEVYDGEFLDKAIDAAKKEQA